MSYRVCVVFFFFFKQKTAYELRISDWSSDVCSSDLQLFRIADIGRVAEDQVERPDDPLAPVPQAKGGATGHLQRLGIASRIAERILARIHADPARPPPFGERGEQQRPRPGAEIEGGARRHRRDMINPRLPKRTAVEARDQH